MHISTPTGFAPSPDPTISNPSPTAAPTLPVSVTQLPYSAGDYANLPTSEKNRYLDFMLANKIPDGPFDNSVEGNQRQSQLSSLIIDLCNNKQFPALNELMKRCSPLSKLPIPITGFTSESLTQFLDIASQYHPQITKICISNPHRFNYESEEQTKIVAKFLTQSKNIESIEIFRIADKNLCVLLDGVSNCSNISALNISPRDITSDKTCEQICRVIQQSKLLKSFELFRPGMSEQSTFAVLLSLGTCPMLERLCIGYWDIDENENLIQLTGLLQDSKCLKELQFDTDEFRFALSYDHPTPPKNHDKSDRELKAIADGIAKNSSLISIQLGYIGRDYDIQKYLIDAIQCLPAIAELRISAISMLPLAVLHDLSVLLESKPTITVLRDERDRPMSFPYAIKQGNPEGTKRLLEQYKQFQVIAERIKDSLEKNQAITNMTWAKVFSNAIPLDQTSTFRPNSIADAREILTNHILANSSNLHEFQNTMVEIALSVNELDDTSAQPPAIQQTNDQTVVLQNTNDDNGKPSAGS